MSAEEIAGKDRTSPAPTGADEDLIESDKPSSRMAGIHRRLDLLIPATFGRKFLGSVTIAALALGLVAGYLVGHLPGRSAAEQAANGRPPSPVLPMAATSRSCQTARPWTRASSSSPSAMDF
ncbi:MAG: hypothetical protein H0T54_05220 [Geodermatophilaceae bacterium]|nr:hypothetical protein [Geodermatophilaceae bacterium]